MGKVASFFREQKITLASQQQPQVLALDKEFDSLESRVQLSRRKIWSFAQR